MAVNGGAERSAESGTENTPPADREADCIVLARIECIMEKLILGVYLTGIFRGRRTVVSNYLA
jgi:hypothetical protein